MSKKNTLQNEPKIFYEKIIKIIQETKNKIYSSANTLMVHAYWNIGKTIIEEEQQGKEKAEYGKKIVESLAERLKASGEKGFDKSNLWMMRQFYLTYPILDAVRRELGRRGKRNACARDWCGRSLCRTPTSDDGITPR